MNGMSLPYPLSPDQIPTMMGALSAGKLVTIGQVSFIADEDCTVWGVDPYGCDFIAANSLDPDKIIASADWHHNPSVPHRAEFSY